MGWGRQQHGAENMAGVLFWKKELSRGQIWWSPEWVSFRQEGQGHSTQRGQRHFASQQQHLHSGHGSGALNFFQCIIFQWLNLHLYFVCVRCTGFRSPSVGVYWHKIMKIMITSVHKTISPSFACYFGSQYNIIVVLLLFRFTKQHHHSVCYFGSQNNITVILCVILAHKTKSLSFSVLFWFTKWQHHHHSLCYFGSQNNSIIIIVILSLCIHACMCSCSSDHQATSTVCVFLWLPSH